MLHHAHLSTNASLFVIVASMVYEDTGMPRATHDVAKEVLW
jgi:hypothetical protein